MASLAHKKNTMLQSQLCSKVLIRLVYRYFHGISEFRLYMRTTKGEKGRVRVFDVVFASLVEFTPLLLKNIDIQTWCSELRPFVRIKAQAQKVHGCGLYDFDWLSLTGF